MENASRPTSSARAVIDRLLKATNDRDLDGLVGCFAPHYVNETPVHPTRGFNGREQVRRNWTQIFSAVPDLVAEVAASAYDEGSVWTEWQMSGNRGDGTPHLMRGVIIFTVAGEQITAARFYLEPVEMRSGNVDTAVASQLAGRP